MKIKISVLVLSLGLLGVLFYLQPFGERTETPNAVTKNAPKPDKENKAGTDKPQTTAAAEDTSAETFAANPSSPEQASSHTASAAPQPLDPEIREALGELVNTSSEGLVEETRNGVTSVDLKGRFRTAPVATLDEEGNIHITDYTHMPKAPNRP